ncbi:MAG: glycine cleavage system aminomethyltransferase GcvT [Rhodospirillales bacterium]|nr:glycine cleavage system aminomethyltransferase GcvT [Rhodospirillales bacterium]
MPIEIAPEEPKPPRASPLAALHARLGARMVPFAGWMLPIQYPAGILAEHRHTREAASLFDVSHMGQVSLAGPGADAALEALTVGDMRGLRMGRQRYTLFTNEAGGILDDLMVARLPDRLHVVVNASRTEHDLTHLQTHLPPGVTATLHEDRALLALQGPRAAAALGRIAPEAAALPFMAAAECHVAGMPALVSRSGYTGEDGFEISLPAAAGEEIAALLLTDPDVQPAGLGARDSLRLEAGLPLYGQDIDELTSPVEAGLTWTIGKRRRVAWDFPGAEPVRDQLDHGATRHRVGLLVEGRSPARAGTNVVAADGTAAGSITSGTFSPSREACIAMAYLRRDLAADGTEVFALLRGKPVPARVVPLPFVPHRYPR